MTRAERRRQEKAQAKKPVYYQYTLEQIEEIKRKAVQDKKDEINDWIQEQVKAEWKTREEAVKGETTEETVQLVLSLLLSIPARVLCEEFGWKPITQGKKDKAGTVFGVCCGRG